MQEEFYSNGKLLLSGEYAILDGALGLAIPTKYGQSLVVKTSDAPLIRWKSLNPDGNVWFTTDFSINLHEITNCSDADVARTLQKLLREAKRQNPNFLSGDTGFEVESHLGFPRNWGLGSSSTLINNIAQWANVDAYKLLWKAFGGSGYDIACAQHPSPITYQLKNGHPIVKQVNFDPVFKDSLFFVHLNQKQSSKAAITADRNRFFNTAKLVEEISAITQKMLHAGSLEAFAGLIEKHEFLLSEILGIGPVKTQLFPDYPGTIKSLGAWGGDFVLVVDTSGFIDYFNKKGFYTIVRFSEMSL